MKKILIAISLLFVTNLSAQTPFATRTPRPTKTPTPTRTPTATFTATPVIVCNMGGPNSLPSTGVGGRICGTVTPTPTGIIPVSCDLPPGSPDLGMASFETGADLECPTFGTAFEDATVTRGIWSDFSLKTAATGSGSAGCVFFGDKLGQLTRVSTGLTHYLNFWFRVETLPVTGEERVYRSRAPGPPNVNSAINIDPAGSLKLYDSPGNLLVTTAPLLVNTWHKIGLMLDGNLGNYEFRIDDVVVGSGGFLGFLSSTQQIDLGKWADINGNSVTYYFDDVSLSSTGFPGSLQMSIGIPTSQGTFNAWTAGTGPSDFSQVNELPPSVLEYVRTTGGSGEQESFNLSSRASQNNSVGRVIAIKPLTWGLTFGTGEFQLGLSDGVTSTTVIQTTPEVGVSANQWTFVYGPNNIPVYNNLYDTVQEYFLNSGSNVDTVYSAYTIIAVDPAIASPAVCTPAAP